MVFGDVGRAVALVVGGAEALVVKGGGGVVEDGEGVADGAGGFKSGQ